jgi:ABC-2 type transport system permease protein
MNAVNHPVSPMGTLRWLLKREYWETAAVSCMRR